MLRHRLARYTAEIATKFSIPTVRVPYDRARFDIEKRRWVNEEFLLPANPYNGRPILLVPKRYLRPLPTINPDDFWKYCYDKDSDELRKMFGEDITSHVNKDTIIDLARKRPDLREDYIRTKEAQGREPYDFDADPEGQFKWYDATRAWTQNHPLKLGFTNAAEFKDFISALIQEFRNFVENNGGWSLLWNENETPKRENAAQLLFLGIVKHYCAANNVDISKEPNIGRGPVDFKIANGQQHRALIELKLIKNTRFWQGLGKQLPKYLEAEGIRDGRFVAIAYSDADIKKIADIVARTELLNAKLPYDLQCEVIDAERDPISASKL